MPPRCLRATIGGIERVYALPEGDTSIGSASGNDIVISVRGVSKHHALVGHGPEGLVIDDLGSRNGVLVGGVRQSHARLAIGDEVRLGPVLLRVELAAVDPGPAPAGSPDPTSAGSADDAAVGAARLAAAALVAQLMAGKATRDALFLSNFDVEVLPALMILAALVAMGAVLWFSSLLSRRAPARLVPLAVAASAALLGLEWALSLRWPRLAAVLVYFHTAAFGATLVSGFWSLVGERFDPHAAKRALARIGTGASLGGVLGGLLTLSVAPLVSIPTMLLLMAALNVVGLLALARVGTPGLEARREATLREGPPSLLLGLRILGEVAYLRDLAVIVGLGAASEALLDYSLKAQAAGLSRQDLISFFALFYSSVALFTLLAQAGLVRRALDRLGLASSVGLLPAVVVLGASVGALGPILLSAALARGFQAVVQASFFRTGYELLFSALPRRRKRPTKTIVDVGFDKLGSALGAGLVLLVATVAPGALERLPFVLCAVLALAALLLSRRLHHGYVEALEESLLSGAVRLDPDEVSDSSTRLAVARTGVALPGSASGADTALVRDAALLSSNDDAAIGEALARQALDPRLVAFAVPLLGRPALAQEAARALETLAPRATGQLCDALLEPAQPLEVRRRLARVLGACHSVRAVEGLVAGLRDPAFEVRRACGLALTRAGAGQNRPGPDAACVFGAALHELRFPGGEATGRKRRLEHVGNVLALVLDGEPLRVALRAVLTRDALRGTALEYLENVLPGEIWSALLPLLGAEGAATGCSRPLPELRDELLRSRAPREATRAGS